MSLKYYGVKGGPPQQLEKFESKVEEVRIQGFTILENVLSKSELENASGKLDALYEKQAMQFGKENMVKINEVNLVRCPLIDDEFFLQLSIKKEILDFIKYFLGDYFILNQQNGIINVPKKTHHQGAWHRDLPYQDYVISEPIAIAALYCIDDFTLETGGTCVIPHSHLLPRIPSLNYIEKHNVPVVAAKGSVILFDAMLYHKAGNNTSDITRRGLNNLYSIPLLIQQINLSNQLQGKYSDDPFLRKFLGYEVQIPGSTMEWRTNRLNKIK